MYTVVRFVRVGVSEAKLFQAGERLNLAVPGAFTGIRKAGDGFAVVVAADESWDEHRRKLKKFVATAREAIADLLADGFRVVVDSAVEPKDYEGKGLSVIALDLDLMRACVDGGVELELSLYAGQGGD